MLESTAAWATRMLRKSERYTRTDMVYLVSGGFWLVLEQAIGVFSSLFVAVMFGNFAGQDTYGNFKFILALGGLLGALSLSGLGNAVAQSVARGFERAFIQGFWLNLRWSGPFVAASIASSIYYGMIGNMFVSASLLVVAVFQPVIASSMLFNSALNGKRDFSRTAFYMTIFNVASAAAVILGLFLGGRAIIIVGVYFATRAATSLFLATRTQALAKNDQEDSGLFRFSAHLSLMGLIGAIGDKLDSIITFTFLGPTGLAVYTFAIAAPEQIKGVAKNMTGLAMPKFASRPLSEIQRTIWYKMLLLTLALTAIAVCYALLAPTLFYYLFPVYMEAVPYSQWYVFSIIFTGIEPVLAAALYAHKKTRELYLATNVGPIVLISSLLVLVPLYGIAGAIASQFLYRAADALTASVLFIRARD